MFCKNCGAMLRDGALFCPNCGDKVEEKEITNVPIEEVKNESKFEPKKYTPIIAIGVVVLVVIGVVVFSKLNDTSDVVANGGEQNLTQQETQQDSEQGTQQDSQEEIEIETTQKTFDEHFRQKVYSVGKGIVSEGDYGIYDDNYLISGILSCWMDGKSLMYESNARIDVSSNSLIETDTGTRKSFGIEGLALEFASVPIGGSKQVEVIFPDDYHDAELIGKKATYIFSRSGKKTDFIEVTPENITDEYVKKVLFKTYGTSTVSEFLDYVEQDLINQNNQTQSGNTDVGGADSQSGYLENNGMKVILDNSNNIVGNVSKYMNVRNQSHYNEVSLSGNDSDLKFSYSSMVYMEDYCTSSATDTVKICSEGGDYMLRVWLYENGVDDEEGIKEDWNFTDYFITDLGMNYGELNRPVNGYFFEDRNEEYVKLIFEVEDENGKKGYEGVLYEKNKETILHFVYAESYSVYDDERARGLVDSISTNFVSN